MSNSKKQFAVVFLSDDRTLDPSLKSFFNFKKISTLDIKSRNKIEIITFAKKWLIDDLSSHRLIVIDDNPCFAFYSLTKTKEIIVCPGNCVETTVLSVQHNDAHVLTINYKDLSADQCIDVINSFIDSSFSELQRHKDRIDFITQVWQDRSCDDLPIKKKIDMVIACDHAGYQYKNEIKKYLHRKYRLSIQDVGAYNGQKANYGLYGIIAGSFLSNHIAKKAIVLCGTGIGIANGASKSKHVRACVCTTKDQVIDARKNWNCNCLAVGARISSLEDIKKMIDSFLNTSYNNTNHRLLHQINNLPRNYLNVDSFKKMFKKFETSENTNQYWNYK